MAQRHMKRENERLIKVKKQAATEKEQAPRNVKFNINAAASSSCEPVSIAILLPAYPLYPIPAISFISCHDICFVLPLLKRRRRALCPLAGYFSRCELVPEKASRKLLYPCHIPLRISNSQKKPSKPSSPAPLRLAVESFDTETAATQSPSHSYSHSYLYSRPLSSRSLPATKPLVPRWWLAKIIMNHCKIVRERRLVPHHLISTRRGRRTSNVLLLTCPESADRHHREDQLARINSISLRSNATYSHRTAYQRRIMGEELVFSPA